MYTCMYNEVYMCVQLDESMRQICHPIPTNRAVLTNNINYSCR